MVDTLTGVKPAVTSTGLWGSLASFISHAGIAVALSHLQPVITDALATGAISIPVQYLPYVGMVASAVAFVGRVTAKNKIVGVVSSAPSGN